MGDTAKTSDRLIRDPQATLREFEDCTLLFHPLFAETVGLTPVGEAIWHALDRGRNPSEVAVEVRAQFDGAPDEVEEDVRTFLADLKRRGFVREEAKLTAKPSPTPLSPPSPNIGRGRGLGEGEGFPAFSLALGDGNRFTIRAGDAKAAEVMEFFARASGLSTAEPETRHGRDLLVVSDGITPVGEAQAICALLPRDAARIRGRQLDEQGQIRLISEPLNPNNWLWQQLARLSAFIGAQAQGTGGVLLHSGLAEYRPHLIPPSPFPSPQRGGEGGKGVEEGSGILLAGRSGVGKTTAAKRLPPPWRSLCDDVALVVRDPEDGYRAHPLPTWSRFFGPEAGDGSDTWDMQRATPLRAIFVLEQGKQDRVEAMGIGQAVALLAELARQTSTFLLKGWSLDEIALFHRQRFENLCALAETVPSYLLDMSRQGAFWEDIAGVIE